MVGVYKTLKMLTNGPNSGLLELVAEGQNCYLLVRATCLRGVITNVIKGAGRVKMRIQFSYQDGGQDYELTDDYDKFVVELPLDEEDIRQNCITPSIQQEQFQTVFSSSSMKRQKKDERATKAAAEEKEREAEMLRLEGVKRQKEEKEKKERTIENERKNRESKEAEKKKLLKDYRRNKKLEE